MKRNLIIISWAAVVAAFSACGDGPSQEEVPQDTAIMAIPVDTLVALDSIGVLMGDSCYMFGSIVSAEALPGGGRILLDRNTGLISEYDPNGDFVRSFGGLGEAPGQFNLPGLMTVLGDGRVAASDWRDREVLFYSPEREYLGSRPAPGGEMPMSISAVGDSCFVTYSCPSRQMGSSFRMGYELTVWEGMTEDPVSTPFSHLFDFGEEEFDFLPGYLTVTGSPGGRIYLHRIASPDYIIEVLDLQGQPVDSITCEAASVPYEEIERYTNLPLAYFMVSIDGESQQISGEVPDFAPQVENLGIDSLGNIWARRGTSKEFMWDIHTPEGELARQAVLVGLPDTSSIRVNINQHGITAWDRAPEDYPRIYLIGFEEDL